MFTAVLRPGNAPAKLGAVGILRRVIDRLRDAFPGVRLFVRLDGGFACPEVLDFLDEQPRLDYVVAIAKNSVLERRARRLMGRARRLSRESQPEEPRTRVRYHCEDLLWRPLGRLVRFVWIDHPLRGRLLLMTTDLDLDPLQVLLLYGRRFRIEVSFKQALHTIGTYAYHFWMMDMTPRRRGSGDQYLHHTDDDYRRLVRRKIDAYHRCVQLGCIAQGLLQHLAANRRKEVWRHFQGWMRTMNPSAPPSEAVVAETLRGTLPNYLATTPDADALKKFIVSKTDRKRRGALQSLG